MRYVSPSQFLVVPPGLLSTGHDWKTSKRRRPGDILLRTTSAGLGLKQRGSSFAPGSLWMSILNTELNHPTVKHVGVNGKPHKRHTLTNISTATQADRLVASVYTNLIYTVVKVVNADTCFDGSTQVNCVIFGAVHNIRS